MIAYKHVRGDYTDFCTGTVSYAPPYPRVVGQDDCDPPTEEVCGRGLHANIRQLDGLRYLQGPLAECRLLEVEVADEDIICRNKEKLRCRRLTVTRELPDVLGPQTEEVTAFLTELPTWPWLKPQTQDAAELARLAFAAVDTANSYSPVVCKRVRFVTWNVARGAAGDAAWGAAWNVARGAAWDAARDAARGAARDAARGAAWNVAGDVAGDAAWGAAWDAARDAAGDAARDAAGDAAWGAAYLVASDLISQPNLLGCLCELWEQGCWPIGVAGEEFILWAGDELAGTVVSAGVD